MLCAAPSSFPTGPPARAVKRPDRCAKIVDGVWLKANLVGNIVCNRERCIEVKPQVLEFIHALLCRYPDPVPRRRLMADIYGRRKWPKEGTEVLRKLASFARSVLEPLGFSIVAVAQNYASDTGCPYTIARMSLTDAIAVSDQAERATAAIKACTEHNIIPKPKAGG